MQIVIDIPEAIKYKVTTYGLLLCPSDKEQLVHAIVNGTLLPKNHGRLIDADKFISEHFGEIARLVDDAPTIIKADKKDEGYANEWIGYSR